MAGFLDLFRGGQQPLQAQQPQQQGGVFSGRLGGLNDPSVALPLAAALMQPGDIGSNLGQGFAMAGQGMETRRKLQQERAMENATAKYLEAQGADAGLVEMARNGGGAQALSAWSQLRKDPMDDLRLKTAQLQYDKLAQGDDGTPETFGLNPIYGQNEKGETVLGVVGNKGTFKPLNTPGFSPSAGIDKIDLGDKWGILDKRNGTITGYEPKNLIGAESDKAAGKAQGEARAMLPAAKLAADEVVQKVDNLIADPYLPAMLGPMQSKLPNWTEDSQRVQGMIEQLSGDAFLQARQALKGGGAITDLEGQRAEAALVRLRTAQSEADFKKALGEFRQHITNGFAILQQQAGVGGSQAPQQAPQGGVSGTTSTNVPFRVVQ